MTITIREREVVGSARQIFRRQHSKPIWGYVESILNAFTAVKDYEYAPHKVATITLKVPSDDGLSHDAWIEDCGIGFVRKYSYLEWKMGYDTTTEEYMREQEDPDCLNKMGIGLNSIAALSKIDTVEFRTVSKNEQGQEGGLVCRYHGYNQAWQIPAEPLSPEYVLGREAGELKTGTRVIIKDVKDVRMKDLENLLIEVFARKLGGKDGYAIGIRETPQDQYTILKRPSNGPIICTCSETVIGEIKNKYGHMVPVKADLHPVEKTADAKVKFLVKKIKLGMYENDYLMKGHIWCDAAEFKPDREGIVIDEYEKTYQQIDDLVMRYAEAYPFDKKSSDTTGVENIKSKKTWEQKLTENYLRYYDKFNDTLLRIKAQKQQSALDGEPIGKLTNVRRNTKHKPEERERYAPMANTGIQ